MTAVKTEKEIELMRQSGKMLAQILNLLENSIEIGISTKQLADIASKELKVLGGKPAFLNYQGFPDVLCTSINQQVVHGIPRNDAILKDGDMIGLDFGVNYQGMITDAAITVGVGSISKENQKLLDGTKEALNAGIKTLKNGVTIREISAKIQEVLDKYGFGIVRDLVGHGVGHNLHEDPNIPNFIISDEPGPQLYSGMTVAIEPMATLGDYQIITEDDKWTIATKDGSMSAHFEHTILITDSSYEILTKQ